MIILVNFSSAVYADSLRVVEVQEQQPDMGIDQRVRWHDGNIKEE